MDSSVVTNRNRIGAQGDYPDPPRVHARYRFGFLTVLFVTGAVVILLSAAFHTAQLVAMVQATNHLQTVADLAVQEATLPKASRASVEQLVVRRLQNCGYRVRSQSVCVEKNGHAVRQWFTCRRGDSFVVTLQVPVGDVFPTPLARWSQLFGLRELSVEAKCSKMVR